MGKVTDVLVSLIGRIPARTASCWHDWPHEQPPRSPPVTGPPLVQATQMVNSYFDPAVKLIYAAGALCG